MDVRETAVTTFLGMFLLSGDLIFLDLVIFFDENVKHENISFAGDNAVEDLDSAKGGTRSARFICIHGRQM